MAKDLLSGIDLQGLDLKASVKELGKVIKREGPNAHKAFHSIERDVEKAGRALYDALAGDDETDTERDILAKIL